MSRAHKTRAAIDAFVSLYSRHAGAHCEAELWPGGDTESHDADAILLVRRNRTKLRVLLEVTEAFQGPMTRYGSSSERFLETLRVLEDDMVRLLPSDCSPTIYWRESARQLLDGPVGDGAKQEFISTLLQVVADQCHAARVSGSAILVNNEVPGTVRSWIRTIAAVRSTQPRLTFRYPLQIRGGITVYSDIPLTTVGISPADVDAAIANKNALQSAYRQRARTHRADRVWLLVVASGKSAASVFSPLTFVGKIPNALPSLGITPNFDAIHLVARGTWAKAEDPLGPTDEWLLVPLLKAEGRSNGGRS